MSMRVLIINSVCGFGSTGRICTGIADKLKSEGNEVIIAYGRGTTNYYNSYKIGNRSDQIWHGIMTRVFDSHGLNSKLATKRFLKWADKYNPDMVWLHNIHGYYINYEMLFDWIKSRPNMQVKWTLHDCWTFTGHCAHYMTVDCEKWQDLTGCYGCELKKDYPSAYVIDNCKRNYQKKKNAFCDVVSMELIVPSEWLAGEVKKSFLKDYPVSVIRNDIDRSIFKPTESDFRKIYGLEDKKIILGVSSIWTRKKGLYDYIELAKMLDDDYCVVLVGAGLEKIDKIKTNNVITISRTDSPKELAGIYTTADWFVNLTYEDNYPTVNLEAEACGTPVITYDTGGCRETVKLENSLVVQRGGLEDILRHLIGEKR